MPWPYHKSIRLLNEDSPGLIPDFPLNNPIVYSVCFFHITVSIFLIA